MRSLFNFLYTRLTGKHKVAGVVGGVTKAIKQLEFVETLHSNRSTQMAQMAVRAHLKAQEASDESLRAARLKNKIQELIS